MNLRVTEINNLVADGIEHQPTLDRGCRLCNSAGTPKISHGQCNYISSRRCRPAPDWRQYRDAVTEVPCKSERIAIGIEPGAGKLNRNTDVACVRPPEFAAGASLTLFTVIETVTGLLLAWPSVALKAKLSGP